MWKRRFQAQQCALFKWSSTFLWKKILNGSKIKSKFLHCDKWSFCPWPWGFRTRHFSGPPLSMSFSMRQWFVGLKRYVHLESMSIFEIFSECLESRSPVLLIQMDSPFSRTPQSFTLHWFYMRPLPTPTVTSQMLCSCGFADFSLLEYLPNFHISWSANQNELPQLHMFCISVLWFGYWDYKLMVIKFFLFSWCSLQLDISGLCTGNIWKMKEWNILSLDFSLPKSRVLHRLFLR